MIGLLLAILGVICIVYGVFTLIGGGLILGIVLIIVGLFLLGGIGYGRRGTYTDGVL
jgi:hypothetical protein